MKKIPEKFETLERLTFNFRYDCAILFRLKIYIESNYICRTLRLNFLLQKIIHAAPLDTLAYCRRSRDGDCKMSHRWDTPDAGDRSNYPRTAGSTR